MSDGLDADWTDHRESLGSLAHVPELIEIYAFMADMDWGDKVRLWRMRRDLKWIFRKANKNGMNWQWPWQTKS